MKDEVAVIGAGITGAFAAYLLARDGHRVVLLDGGTAPYRGTSCNPGGINPLHGPGLPQPMAEFYLASHRLHSQLRDEVISLSGIDYGYRVIDRLFLAFSREEQSQLLAMGEDYQSQEGFSARWLGPDQLKSLDQRISEQALGGLFTCGNSIVDSELYCEALQAAALKLGCRYLPSDVRGFLVQSGRISHVATAEAKIACSAAVIATGYSAQRLCGELGMHIPVGPLKGELLIARLPGGPLPFDMTRGQAGIYQFKEDLFWLGGTRAAPGEQPGTTEQGRRDIIAGIAAMMPDLDELDIVGHEAGYRPQSADNLPVVGFLPGYENVLIGTGGGSKGILVSAGIASSLCDMIAKGRDAAIPDIAPQRFDVSP